MSSKFLSQVEKSRRETQQVKRMIRTRNVPISSFRENNWPALQKKPENACVYVDVIRLYHYCAIIGVRNQLKFNIQCAKTACEYAVEKFIMEF